MMQVFERLENRGYLLKLQRPVVILMALQLIWMVVFGVRIGTVGVCPGLVPKGIFFNFLNYQFRA